MDNGGLTTGDLALMDRGGFGGGDAFMWIFALLILAGGGFGGMFGNGYRGPNPATTEDVQNQFNFAALERQNNETVAAVAQAKYDAISSLKETQAELTAQLTDIRAMEQNINTTQMECCCNTLRAIDGVNYNNAMNTAAINANTTAQTQKILDAITGNRMADMQNEINQLQLAQATNNVVRYPNAMTYAYMANPFCGNGCGCGI